MKKFDWIIVGGGISGISLSEILTREGYSVALIEKNKKLAAETTREFHEWFHTGSLYTLLKDDMKTLKYILGSLDDVLEFYSSYSNMNLMPNEKGLLIKDEDKGWFKSNYINFKYRIKNRKLIFTWIYAIARSISLIDGIKKHDWLRRRAGILESVTSEYYVPILKNLLKVFFNGNKFLQVESSDFTMNSRSLLRDMISTSCKNGLEIFTDNELLNISNLKDGIVAECSNGKYQAEKMAICLGGGIEKFSEVKINKSYAPIAVVKKGKKETKTHVELDCFKKNCVKKEKKKDSYGLIGGISLSKEEEVDKYFDFMINEHKKMNPNIEVMQKYVGIKNEVTYKKDNRNYLFHINKSQKYDNLWSVIPGKFTLAFSMAPEFYRLIYKKNPKKFFKTYNDNGEYKDLINETVWQEIQNKR